MSDKNSRTQFSRRLALHGALAVLLFGAAGVCAADQFGVQVAAGVGDHCVKFDLGVVWDPNLTRWQIGTGIVRRSARPTSRGGAPMEATRMTTSRGRLDTGDPFHEVAGLARPFLEVGAGVRLPSSPHISSDFTLGTAFHCAEFAGVGCSLGLIRDTWRATASSMFPMAVSKSRILV
jgi:lipid A 3-O-deacylase